MRFGDLRWVGAFFDKDVKRMGMGGGEYLSSWVSCIDSFASCSGECKISTTDQTLSNASLSTVERFCFDLCTIKP
jgi:hypothetical protein